MNTPSRLREGAWIETKAKREEGMTIKPDYAAQAFNLDFGDEAPYAFGFLEGNKRINDEIFKRAIERAKLKRKDTLLQHHPRPQHQHPRP